MADVIVLMRDGRDRPAGAVATLPPRPPTRSSPRSWRRATATRGARAAGMTVTARAATAGCVRGRRRRCAGARDGRRVVVGSKEFTESVILGEMVAALARGAGARRRAPPRARRHRGRVPRAGDRRHRRLSRVHRHADRGDPARRGAGRIATSCRRRARRAGPAHDRAARLQQQLRASACPRRARRRSGISRISDLARHPELALVLSQRVHEPRRRLARAARPLRAAPRARAAWTTTSPTARSRAAPST